jgi:MSHA pilin protein MshA
MRKGMMGFTLIELVIVIVIITIVSVVVLPRFIDIGSMATKQVIHQTEGAMRSTSALFHAEALVKNVNDDRLEVAGNDFDVRGGYIRGHWNLAWRYVLDIGKVIEFTPIAGRCTKNELCGVGNQSNATGLPFSTGGVNGLVLIWPNGYLVEDLCYAYYFNRGDGTEPKIGSVTTGC